MPSQVADDLWHEFILYTLKYENFCKQAFGRFLHHAPADVLTNKGKSNHSLRRVWNETCREEIINPRKPTRLPLLFALDAKLNIKDGFTYIADCEAKRTASTQQLAGGVTMAAVIYCGGDFYSPSYFPNDSSTSSCAASGSSCSSDSSSDSSSGCSSGCSGGCGGGGD